MNTIPITLPRLNDPESERQLQAFIFGGRYALPRVPRGIRPELVSSFLRARLRPDSPAEAYAKAGALLRFYERADVVPHLLLTLNGQERTDADVQRSALVVQSVGDLGTPEQIAQAANYFDQTLVRHPQSMEAIGAMLDALVALAPAGSPEKLSKRLTDEIERASHIPDLRGPDALRYRKLSDVQRNDLPGTLFLIEGKKKILALPPAERRAQLTAIYLDQSELSDPMLQIWAARTLRQEAMTGDADAVRAEFAKLLDAETPSANKGDEDAGFIVARAGQAIVYLQGKLTKIRQKALDRSQGAAMNFLCDDL